MSLVIFVKKMFSFLPFFPLPQAIAYVTQKDASTQYQLGGKMSLRLCACSGVRVCVRKVRKGSQESRQGERMRRKNLRKQTSTSLPLKEVDTKANAFRKSLLLLPVGQIEG